MYNRYIPQPDGTYRRNRIPEPRPPQTHRRPQHAEPPPCPPPEDTNCEEAPKNPGKPNRLPPSKQEQSAFSFLRQLLPKNLDTGDLLVIILLLLMAGDCAEDQNTAMLTLAMYLFM